MATTTGKTHCVTCGKGKVTYKCEGCSQYFCIIHLPDHHQVFSKELDEIEGKSNLFQETLIEQRKNPHKHSLIQQINQWEEDSIHKIQQTAEEARQVLLEHTGENINEIEIKLTRLTKELKEIREENDFNEIVLNEFKQKLEQLEEQLNKPSNISIRQDFSLFIMKISVLTTPSKSSKDDSHQPTDEQAKNFVKVKETNTNNPIFGGGPSLKPSTNANSGFSFACFGDTSSIFSFQSTAAASANKPLFDHSPKFSFSDLAKQTSSNDKPTSNVTEQRVFAGQGSLIFDTSSTNTTTTTENNNEDDSYEPNISFKPIVQLSAVEVKTGEEDENVLFCERGKLYRFDSETNQMKERGIGEMKILQHKTTNLCRILMRREQVLKICANHQITSQMELKPHQGSADAYVWSAIDFADGEAKHETLCIRFKSNDIAKRFFTQFNDAKTANANSSP